MGREACWDNSRMGYNRKESMLTFKYLCVKFLRTTKAIKCVRIRVKMTL